MTKSRRGAKLKWLTVAEFRLILGIATSEKPGDRRDAGCARSVADSFFDQPVSNLPREYPWIVALVLLDPCLNLGRGHSRFAASDHARPDAPRLLVPIQNLRHASVRHPQLPVRNHESQILQNNSFGEEWGGGRGGEREGVCEREEVRRNLKFGFLFLRSFSSRSSRDYSVCE